MDGYNIRFGTVNHYLSQFFYLCLGYRENYRTRPPGRRIDIVLAGHAHWNMEFELREPPDKEPDWKPKVRYGRFSGQVEDYPGTEIGPLLLQTAACGPTGKGSDDVPPNFRYIKVRTDGQIEKLRPCNRERPPQLGPDCPRGPV